MVREQTDAIGKETEKQPHEKVSSGLRLRSALRKTGGELGKLRCCGFRYAGGGGLGLEFVRFGE